MNQIQINEAFCPKNHHCPVVRACPTGAITQRTSSSAPIIDDEKCTGCGICTRYCPTFSSSRL